MARKSHAQRKIDERKTARDRAVRPARERDLCSHWEQKAKKAWDDACATYDLDLILRQIQRQRARVDRINRHRPTGSRRAVCRPPLPRRPEPRRVGSTYRSYTEKIAVFDIPSKNWVQRTHCVFVSGIIDPSRIDRALADGRASGQSWIETVDQLRALDARGDATDALSPTHGAQSVVGGGVSHRDIDYWAGVYRWVVACVAMVEAGELAHDGDYVIR